MPAVRDFSFNYTTVATANTVACDVPDHRQNDLLLAILSADTGTLTWTSSGWTQFTSQTNTPNLAIMWKIASAAEPASYTFTSSGNETLNAAIVSIEDVDTTTPLGNFAQVNRTSASLAFPTTTTTRANSLVLYASSHGSTAVIPTAIEGGVTYVFAKDGSAHSDSLSWAFKPTVGTTAAVLSSVSGTTFDGKLITFVVNPPATGATVIPAYCSADLSSYIDPIHGTTAFRGNSALAATATTSFGATIAGKSMTNAAVSAAADKGINTYRSAGGQTSSTNRTWLGLRSALAAAITTAAGKNILCHVGPNVIAEMQTLESFSLERGVAFGMYASANNFKIWHVHGANTVWETNRAPVVINSASTTGILQATGTLTGASIAGFGFFTSGFVTSADLVWTMLWALDTTTVCGGTTSRPVSVSGIVRSVATGHERISALQQGATQMLTLQPIQIGNGTDQTILDLGTCAVEFAGQYNLSTAQVYYNSADNVAGITFFPSANDVFDIRSALFSSSSKFHFRLHASSNANATFLTHGCQIINSGDVQLRAAIPFDGVTFDRCNAITQNGCTITDTIFDSSTITADNIGLISSCQFTSSGTGNAIIITVPGTYTFSGNLFSGYSGTPGDNPTPNSGDVNAAIYNNSGGSVVIQISGGGDTPSVRNGASATTDIVASANVTLTGIVPGTEVRAYVGTNPATSTELDGIESTVTVDPNDATKTIFNFAQSVSGQAGYIQIFNVNYQPVFLTITYSGSDVSIPVQQVLDRNYQP